MFIWTHAASALASTGATVYDLLLAARDVQDQVILVTSEHKSINKKDGHVTIVGKQIHTEIAGMDTSEEDGIVLIKCKFKIIEYWMRSLFVIVDFPTSILFFSS